MKNIGIPQNKTLITVDRKDGSGLLKEWGGKYYVMARRKQTA